jgi:acetylornithine deacetylase/succinyl-diaminopimelate desuccinylase-like protein
MHTAAGDRLRDTFERLAPWREWLLAHDAETVGLQVSLAEIPSPTGDEARRGSAVASAFAAAGYQPSVDGTGNVVAQLAGESAEAPVIVCAHLDTVFGPEVAHRVHTSGRQLVGPGIGDNARGLAAMLRVAAIMRSLGQPRHSVVFAATVGEEGEGDLRGARHLFATAGAGAAAAVVLDGAGDERVVTHALGTRRFRVQYEGEGGHSWAASDAPNPLHAAAHFASAVALFPRPTQPRSALAVTRVHGGDAVNAIPAHASVDIDARSSSTAILDQWEAALRRMVREAMEGENARRGPRWSPLRGRLQVVSDRPAGAVGEDSPVVRVALQATECIGRRPECAIASTDANVPLSMGIPAVALGGGGRGGDTHTLREWFENRDGALGVARALTVITALAQLH